MSGVSLLAIKAGTKKIEPVEKTTITVRLKELNESDIGRVFGVKLENKDYGRFKLINISPDKMAVLETYTGD